jgi:hypothetical protein
MQQITLTMQCDGQSPVGDHRFLLHRLTEPLHRLTLAMSLDLLAAVRLARVLSRVVIGLTMRSLIKKFTIEKVPLRVPQQFL